MPPGPGLDELLDDFFSLDGIHEIRIDLDEAGWDDLLEEPHEYTEADFTIDGARYERVGLRLKGAAGSFVPLDAEEGDAGHGEGWHPPKPAFVVDLDQYEAGQRHLGLEKLALNNLVQDVSGIHEFVTYALFREASVPAPRIGWAGLELNGEERGLYVLVESEDNDEFLRRWFDSTGGDLWEGGYDVDLRADRVEQFEHDRGNGDRSALEEIVATLDALDPGQDPLDALDEVLDGDLYLAFATAELFAGHWDGYAWSINNYRLHADEDGEDWTFLPWGVDQTLGDFLEPYAGVMQKPGPRWPAGGRLHRLCVESESCRLRLAEAWDETLDLADDLDLEDLAEQAVALVEDRVLDDAARWGEPEWAEEAWEGVLGFLEDRPGAVREWLPCLEGDAVDQDEDGFDGCTEDCDDRRAEVHPGAAEQCDFVDQDCNGVLDDPADCPRCRDQQGPDGRAYSLCVEKLGWTDAHAYCQDRGQDLASLHGEETWEALGWAFVDLAGVWESWIGLSDREQEGTFLWTDGSPLDLQLWYDEEAQAAGDCTVDTLWGWYANDCTAPLPFLCGGE